MDPMYNLATPAFTHPGTARIVLLTAVLLLGAPLAASGQQQLLWSDEFNSGTAPDGSVWSYDLGGGGPNKQVTAAITVLDENGAAVEGATVTATFRGSHNETVSASTNSSGVAALATAAWNRSVSFTVCVDAAAKATKTYDSAANVETCDSL